MIDAYSKNPLRYLSFAACRRVLRGDASSLLKIYGFLQAEGIINYCLSNAGNYSFQPPATARPSQLTKRPQSCVKKLPEAARSQQQEEMDTDNLTVTVINKNFSRTFRVYCSRCRLICGIVWYSSLEESPRHLCFECHSRSEPEVARQFAKVDILKKMESSKDSKAGKTSWGLEDNVKLLDYMGSCEGRSWKELADQFEGKKALEDIIIQFMQFPITNYDPNHHAALLQHQEVDIPQQEHVTPPLPRWTCSWTSTRSPPFTPRQRQRRRSTPSQPRSTADSKRPVSIATPASSSKSTPTKWRA